MSVFTPASAQTREGQLKPEKWGEAHATTSLFLVRKDDEEDGDQAWTGQMGPLVYLILLYSNGGKGHILLNLLLTIMAFFSRVWL